jgi:hypothetical protein
LVETKTKRERPVEDGGSSPFGEEITMLEFWCIVIFAALAASSIWLIHGLDGMMEGEP